MNKRLAPFLDLLDVRYLPLLAVIAPQSYTVYAWLLSDGAPGWVASLGGFGYESVYVGAVAWAERGAGWKAARPPAVAALLFSVAVSVAYYAPHVGALAILHAGFPIVAYAYTVTMHAHQVGDAPHDAPAPIDDAAHPPEPPTHDAPLPTHRCVKCGASVASQQKAAASGRWGCDACKVVKAHTNGHVKEVS